MILLKKHKNIITLKTIQIVLLFVLSSTSIAQEENAVFDHLTIKDGLSNSLVLDITQDSSGFIWLATKDGLNNFDGYTFTVFRGDDSLNTVPDNWITSVKTDKHGNIWYGTRTAGIGNIDCSTGIFTNFRDRMLEEFDEYALNIQNLFFTRDYKLLISTWGAGLLIYDIDNSIFSQYAADETNENSLSENRIYSVLEDSNGNLWAGTHRTGLNRIDISTGEFTHFNFKSNEPGIVSNNFILAILEDSMGDVWVGTYTNGLYKILKGSDKIVHYDSRQYMTGKTISRVFEDSRNNIWVCSGESGIFKYIREENRFINYRNNPIQSKSLNRNMVWSVMEDRTGLLWFGTSTNGVNIYDRNKNIFNWIVREHFMENTIASSYVKCILKDSQGNLWLGSTTDGISVIDPKGSIKLIQQSTGGLNNNNIRIIFEDRHGKIWIGTWGGGINIYNPANNKFSYIEETEAGNSLADNYLKCIREYNNKMYFGTERGLNEYDPLTGDFKLFLPNIADSTTISHLQISVLFIDSKNNFWIGTPKGLNLFDPVKGTFRRIKIDNSRNTPQRYRISEVFEDSKGRLWIGTSGAGFAWFSPEEYRFKFYTEDNGLSNNTVYEILEDESGNLWISTNSGLNKFTPDTETFRIYRSSDGLPGDEFNGGAAYKDTSGMLYFGGVEGLTYFHPSELISESKIPDIEITRITINGKEIVPTGFYNSVTELVTPYDSNFINISFAAMDFSNPEANSFRYKLEGLSDEWVSTEHGNTAVFTNLDYGEYSFHVQGTNNNGVWNNEGRKLSIVITPAWWNTVWFRLIATSLVLLLIYSTYQYRIRQINERQKLLKKLVDERTKDLNHSKELLQEAVEAKDKLFSIIAHDLKNPFVALLGYSEMLTQELSEITEEELKECSNNIYDASRSVYSLLQNLLDWARIQLNTIECLKVNVDVRELIKTSFSIYKTTAAIKHVRLINNITESIFVNVDENMIHSVLRNVISNSIKFTEQNGWVESSAEIIDNRVEISIADNGIGMSPETVERISTHTGHQFSAAGTSHEQGTGLGIMLVKEFLIKNDGKLKIDSNLGKGTKITIILPAAAK